MNKFIKAFTLIELLVSVSIMTVILSVVLYNYGSFNDRLSLSAAAQELAVGIRQSQTYGINVKESAASSGQFGYAYGIYFSNQTSSYYSVFVDSNNNNKFDGGGELV
jgi:prepilin-type N-terminal cleavage/methylation domain-containing protein